MVSELTLNFGTAYYIGEWIVRIVMLLVVPLRRTAAATRSWLLLILFLPLPGLLLFLAIGRPSFPAWRRARFASLSPFLAASAEKLAAVANPQRASPYLPSALVRQLGGWPVVGGNGIEFLDEYDDVIERLIADIATARHHVRLMVYLFADDATGQRVIAALGRAVQRGVVCHVLVDPEGSRRWTKTLIPHLRQLGVEVRRARPFHWVRARTRRDMRNHRKLFLIDGKIGYAGSQNIVAKNYRRKITNQELVLRMTGPIVAGASAVFVSDWYLESKIMLSDTIDIPERCGTSIAQLLPSGADYAVQGFETLLISQTHAAQDRVIITTPYLIPDEGLLGAMRTATLRGVSVDVIVSAVIDQRLVGLAQRSYYEELLQVGVRIDISSHFQLAGYPAIDCQPRYRRRVRRRVRQSLCQRIFCRRSCLLGDIDRVDHVRSPDTWLAARMDVRVAWLIPRCGGRLRLLFVAPHTAITSLAVTNIQH